MSSETQATSRRRECLPFAEARELVHSLGLVKQKDYEAKSKAAELPAGLPGSPSKYYGTEFQGWGDFLGSGGAKRNRRAVRGQTKPFAEARDYVRRLGFKTQKEYAAWARTDQRPADIPANPAAFYKHDWINYADFLGIQLITYRPFSEAREFARSLGLKRRREWHEYARSDQLPADVPPNPDGSYSDWGGWQDWLGQSHTWNRNTLLTFLKSLRPVLASLAPAELLTILDRGGLLKVEHRKRAKTLRAIEGLCRADDKDAAIDSLIDQLGAAGGGQADVADADAAEIDANVVSADELQQQVTVPEIRSISDLSAADAIASSLLTDDDEIIEFLISNRVAGLWCSVFEQDPAIRIDDLRQPADGKYDQEIRRQFLAQYDGAINLPLPTTYAYRKAGAHCEPTLMQKLTAYRVLQEGRAGNWSTVGTGRTTAAVFASLVVDSKLTIVVAFNSTLERWEEEIRAVCPTAAINSKGRGPFMIEPDRPTFIVMNYESFQQPWGATELVANLAKFQIDFIVLDEIQSTRQRNDQDDSRRRQTIRQLLETAANRNPNLRVLGMSATPVINNLIEAQKTLEMITGKNLNSMPTRPTTANAIRFHQLMVRHGVRYQLKYSQQVEVHHREVDGTAALTDLLALPRRGHVPALERILLKEKLPLIANWLKPGTLIYTNLVDQMVEPLDALVRQLGLTVGRFTGDDKDGLGKFTRRLDTTTNLPKVDVLIGSSPVGTGIDGLQYVCDRVIFACLPWTSAEYTQIIGRLTRLGGTYPRIEVFIPVVTLKKGNGDSWSWDRYRLQCIDYKRTLADAVIDGTVPESRLPTQDEMYTKSVAALQEWEKEVEAPSEQAS